MKSHMEFSAAGLAGDPQACRIYVGNRFEERGAREVHFAYEIHGQSSFERFYCATVFGELDEGWQVAQVSIVEESHLGLSPPAPTETGTRVISDCLACRGRRLGVLAFGSIVQAENGATAAESLRQQNLYRYVRMMGSDTRLDQKGADTSLNTWPACGRCGYPDLSVPPSPYLLNGSRVATPKECMSADAGNLLVRPRVADILQLVAPGSCDYYPTVDSRTGGPTPWRLAIPRYGLRNAAPISAAPRCGYCGNVRGDFEEPFLFIPSIAVDVPEYDILQSSLHVAAGRCIAAWILRDLHFSCRLRRLFKALKIKDLHPGMGGDDMSLLPAEKAWVKEQLARIEAAGIPIVPRGTLTAADRKWFNAWLRKGPCGFALKNYSALQKKHKFKIPRAYLDFLEAWGPRKFTDVEGQFDVTTLDPLDFEYRLFRRHSRDHSVDPENTDVDGIGFAHNGCGDFFVMDVSAQSRDYPILYFDHELNCLDPYADTMAECLRRFTRNDFWVTVAKGSFLELGAMSGPALRYVDPDGRLNL